MLLLLIKYENVFILFIIKSDKQTFKCISACVNDGTSIHTTKRAACEQLPGCVRPQYRSQAEKAHFLVPTENVSKKI